MSQPKIKAGAIDEANLDAATLGGFSIGTGSNGILQLNGSSQIPAVNGSLLTNVNAATLGGQPVGTGPNDIVALNGSSQLPAVDGSLLTNLPASLAITGIDVPVETAITLQTSTSAAWQTMTVNASAKFAMVASYSRAIFNSNSGNSLIQTYVRKKGLSGNAGPGWQMNAVGADDGASTANNHGMGFTMVECNASGQFEFYGYQTGSINAPTSTIKVVAWF